MRRGRIIVFCLIGSLIVLTINYGLFNTIQPKLQLAKGDNEQHPQEIQWNKTYGGPGWEHANGLIQTTDGGFALAGRTSSYGAENEDMWLIKTDPNGIPEWNQSYDGETDDEASALIQTTDGGFAIVGSIDVFSHSGGVDMWLVKTDANGVPQWNKTYGGTEDDYNQALVQTKDGGFAIAGNTESFGAGKNDMWLVKTDENGTHLWNKTYGGTEFDSLTDLVQTTDGGFALAGNTESFGAGVGTGDMWLVKTDENGVEEWNKTYGWSEWEMVLDFVQTIDGGFALAGFIRSFELGIHDMWLVKTDTNGTAQWNHTYNGLGNDDASALVQTKDGGFALAGSTYLYDTSKTDIRLVKTDENGFSQWNMTIARGRISDAVSTLVQTTDGGFALAGWTHFREVSNYDMWLVKTKPTGISLTTTTQTTTTTETTTTTTQGTPGLGPFSLLVAVVILSIRYRRQK